MKLFSRKTCIRVFLSTIITRDEQSRTRPSTDLYDQIHITTATMVVSPAVLSKGKKTQKSTSSVSFADAVNSNGPVASTSKVPIAGSSSQDGAQMEDDDAVEGDGEWQSRQSAAHPNASTVGKENSQAGENEDEEDDDAVMIDSNTLLPPIGSSNAEGEATGADQGLLKFPALSAKEMQGKVETQSRKVSVRS